MLISINDLNYCVLVINSDLQVIEHNDEFQRTFFSSDQEKKAFHLELISKDLSLAIQRIISSNMNLKSKEFIFSFPVGSSKENCNCKIFIDDLKNGLFLVTFFDLTISDIYLKNKIDIYQNLSHLIENEYTSHINAIIDFSSFGKNIFYEDSEMFYLFNKIEKSANSANSLTNQFFALSNEKSFSGDVINLNEVVKENMLFFQKAFAASITIDLELSLEELVIFWDKNQINIILTNIFMNSFESIQALNKIGRIKVTTKKIEANNVIIIEDDGGGISKDNLERVFNKNFTTKDIRYHSGLGLSVVEGIMRNLNGKINITSKPRAGVFVELTFPSTTKFFSSLIKSPLEDTQFAKKIKSN